MLLSRASLAFLLGAAIVAAPAYATPTHKKPVTSHARTTSHTHSTSQTRSAHHTTAHHSTRSSAKSHQIAKSSRHHKLHGQQAIAPERVSQIQQALIREHYLSGDASGQWDPTTVSAMKKYQADQGWQTKLMPDSRALKKLGLGPDYSDAINASGASFNSPKSTTDISAGQVSGFAAASGVNR